MHLSPSKIDEEINNAIYIYWKINYFFLCEKNRAPLVSAFAEGISYVLRAHSLWFWGTPDPTPEETERALLCT